MTDELVIPSRQAADSVQVATTDRLLFPFAAAAFTQSDSIVDRSVEVQEKIPTGGQLPTPIGSGCLWCCRGEDSDQDVSRGTFPSHFFSNALFGIHKNNTGIDYLELQCGTTVAAVSADWSKVGEHGILCESALVYFDAWNASGSKVWSQGAHGNIVVARRGEEAFEATARNAEKAGAIAVVIVDDDAKWDDDIEMTTESGQNPPGIPAILVPQTVESMLTGTLRRYASIVRR